MRLRTGHGPNDWTESIPAATGSSRLGGELVVGGPGSFDRQRIAEREHKAWRQFGEKRVDGDTGTPENQVCQASESPEVPA